MLTGPILLELMTILLIVQLCGALCRLIGQPWVIGEILAGLVLGPSLFGALWPGLQAQVFSSNTSSILQTLGDIGLVLYMFSLGAQLDTQFMLKQGRKAFVTALSSTLFPLLLAAPLAYFLFAGFAGAKANLLSFTLLIGTAIAVTAFPVLARLLTERQMLGTRIGALALTSAAINDVLAWFLLALVIAIIHANNVIGAVIIIGLTILFIGIMLAMIRPLLLICEQRIPSKHTFIALVFILLLISAYTTNAIGIHFIFGAFMTGLILPRKTHSIEYTKNLDQVNNLLFLPLYFAYSGLHTQIGLIHGLTPWLICALVLVIACAGKLLGGALPLRWMGETWREALSLGSLLNTRGLIELIIINIGLDLGVFSPTLFAIFVIMALITTMMTSPLLYLLGYRNTAQRAIEEHTAVELQLEKPVL